MQPSGRWPRRNRSRWTPERTAAPKRMTKKRRTRTWADVIGSDRPSPAAHRLQPDQREFEEHPVGCSQNSLTSRFAALLKDLPQVGGAPPTARQTPSSTASGAHSFSRVVAVSASSAARTTRRRRRVNPALEHPLDPEDVNAEAGHSRCRSERPVDRHALRRPARDRVGSMGSPWPGGLLGRALRGRSPS
jgi:hypothetical protein